MEYPAFEIDDNVFISGTGNFAGPSGSLVFLNSAGNTAYRLMVDATSNLNIYAGNSDTQIASIAPTGFLTLANPNNGPILDVKANYTTGAGFSGICYRAEVSTPATSAFDFGRWAANGVTQFRFYGNGNGKCAGSWTGGGADFAEAFPCVAKLGPGQTVRVDKAGTAIATRSGLLRRMADRLKYGPIVGAVSTKPTIIGDMPEDDKLDGYAVIGLLGKLQVLPGQARPSHWRLIGPDRYLVK